MTSSINYPESPLILNLAAKIQIDLCDQKSVIDARQTLKNMKKN